MVHVLDDFKAFPNSVRNGLLFLVIGWIWHYFSLYRYFFNGNIPFNQIVIGVSICYFVFRIKNWARVLCLVSNSLIILMYLSVTYSFFVMGKPHLGVVSGLNVILFSIATYFLAIGESSGFFKERSPRPTEKAETESKSD
jgi:hypothetical protein